VFAVHTVFVTAPNGKIKEAFNRPRTFNEDQRKKMRQKTRILRGSVVQELAKIAHCCNAGAQNNNRTGRDNP
jgi:hypothetical protein